MAFLDATELPSYYKPAGSMDQDDVKTYLQRANAYAKGEIGGIPPALPGDDGADLKAAVALAFEIFSKGETAQVNTFTGNITDVAPGGQYSNNNDKDPLDTVKAMLRPYRIAFEAANAAQTDRGVKFL